MQAALRLLLTPGEPAGIGPDLCVQLVQRAHPVELVAVGDPALLQRRAALLGLPLRLHQVDGTTMPQPYPAGELGVMPVALAATETPGQLDVRNAGYLLDTLRIAADECLAGRAAGVVTAPLQKSVINDAGIPFSGHTEYFAERCGVAMPVMVLTAGTLRVALATTHLPLRAVPDAITPQRLIQVLRALDQGLRDQFGIGQPRILVCGLNPHAGEGGGQWSPDRAELERSNVALRYRNPASGSRFDIAYRDRIGLLEQTDVSFNLPVSSAWRLGARSRYSIRDEKTLESFVGASYETCCWAISAAYRRFITGADGALNNGIYFQLELKGLSRIGTGFASLLPSDDGDDAATPGALGTANNLSNNSNGSGRSR